MFTLSGYLVSKSADFVKFSTGSILQPGLFTYTEPIHVSNIEKNTYEGKVVILVNEETQNQAEYTAMALSVVPFSAFIGSQKGHRRWHRNSTSGHCAPNRSKTRCKRNKGRPRRSVRKSYWAYKRKINSFSLVEKKINQAIIFAVKLYCSMKKIILSLLLVVSFVGARATHLTGGYMYYTYMGKDGAGNKKFKVSLLVYRDCQSSQVQFDNQIDVAIYRGNDLDSIIILTLKSEKTVSPTNVIPAAGSVCTREGLYEFDFVADKQISNYTMLWQRCCRNTSSNLIDDMGNSYYVTIINSVDNSAPTNNNSNAFITGAGLNASFSLSHYDRDGDSLSYHLVRAISGLSSTNPTAGAGTYPSKWTILPSVVYRNGFSSAQQMGALPNYANLNYSSGVLSLSAKSTGRYFISYEVSEWRKGVLLSTHYREVILYSVNVHPAFKNNISISANTFSSDKKEINLNWSYALEGTIKDFTIERRLSGKGNWQKMASIQPESQNFTDTSIQYDNSYWYRVYADTIGGIVYSDSVKAGINKGGNNLGQEEISNQSTLTLYPNPATDKLFLSLPNNTQIQQWALIDLQGRLIKSGGGTTEISTQDLPQGLYLLRAETNNGEVMARFVKQ